MDVEYLLGRAMMELLQYHKNAELIKIGDGMYKLLISELSPELCIALMGVTYRELIPVYSEEPEYKDVYAFSFDGDSLSAFLNQDNYAKCVVQILNILREYTNKKRV